MALMDKNWHFFLTSSGDTIRIFRRSRSGRPTSAQSTEVLESQDDKLLRTEDLPAPDTIAGVKEANAK
jgi:hypothetical protein